MVFSNEIDLKDNRDKTKLSVSSLSLSVRVINLVLAVVSATLFILSTFIPTQLPMLFVINGYPANDMWLTSNEWRTFALLYTLISFLIVTSALAIFARRYLGLLVFIGATIASTLLSFTLAYIYYGRAGSDSFGLVSSGYLHNLGPMFAISGSFLEFVWIWVVIFKLRSKN
jgi:hypothetical protein